MKSKKLLILMLIISFLCIMKTNNVQAVLYASGNTPITKKQYTWLSEIRKMENMNGGFGLTETQNSDLTYNGASNNIDVHMQKNTEYGTMVLLSASAYGKSDKVNSGETTTGNGTGVYIEGNKEWVAAKQGNLNGKDERYYDVYTDDTKTSGISGDATFETENWHGGTNEYMKSHVTGRDHYGTNYLVRLTGNSLFSYSNYAYYMWDYSGAYTYQTAYSEKEYTSRIAVVNGEGI